MDTRHMEEFCSEKDQTYITWQLMLDPMLYHFLTGVLFMNIRFQLSYL